MVEETLLTNREISKWLAQGNGEYITGQVGDTGRYTVYDYSEENENKPVNEKFKIRKWSDTDWHKPTKEYIAPKGHYETRPKVTIDQSPFIPNETVFVSDEDDKPAWFRQ